MRSDYPEGVAGSMILEHVYDMGFSDSAATMSRIFDAMLAETRDPAILVDQLTAFFAVANVKMAGGSKEDMRAVADLYGYDALANSLKDEDFG